jgi:hypothetical protein
MPQRVLKTMKKKLVIAILVALLVSSAFAYAVLRVSGPSDQARFEKLHADIDYIIHAASNSSGDVRSDLVRRGLLVEPRYEGGEAKPGEIWFGKIGDLIKNGVYHIDQQGVLQFGPAPEDVDP